MSVFEQSFVLRFLQEDLLVLETRVYLVIGERQGIPVIKGESSPPSRVDRNYGFTASLPKVSSLFSASRVGQEEREGCIPLGKETKMDAKEVGQNRFYSVPLKTLLKLRLSLSTAHKTLEILMSEMNSFGGYCAWGKNT